MIKRKQRKKGVAVQGVKVSLVAIVLAIGLGGPGTSLFAQNVPQLRGDIYNPVIAPTDPDLIAYERQTSEARELFIYNHADRSIQLVTAGAVEAETNVLPSLFGTNESSRGGFEGRLSWRPERDRQGRLWFVFVSSQQYGFELRLGYLDRENRVSGFYQRLPFDGQADLPEWSPDGNMLVFCGRPQNQRGYQIVVVQDMESVLRNADSEEDIARAFRYQVLTDNPEGNLFPAWSPNGVSIAYQSLQQGESGLQNWGINVINLSSNGSVSPSIRLTGELDRYHEQKPSWSPNGNRIAFYVSNSAVGEEDGNEQLDVAILNGTPNARGGIDSGFIGTGMSVGGFNNRVQVAVRPAEVLGPVWIQEPGGVTSLLYVKVNPGSDPLEKGLLSLWSNRSNIQDPYVDLSSGWNTILHREPTVFHCEQTGANRFVYVSQVQNQLQLQVRDSDTALVNACKERAQKPVPLPMYAVPGLPAFHSRRSKAGLAVAGVSLGALAVGILADIQWGSQNDDFEAATDALIEQAANVRGLEISSECNEARNTNPQSTCFFYDQLQDEEPDDALRIVSIAGYGVFAGLLVASIVNNLNRSPGASRLDAQYMVQGDGFGVRKPVLYVDPVGSRPQYTFTLQVDF